MRRDLATAIVVGAQRAMGVCAWIDMSASANPDPTRERFSVEAARAAGIDLAALLVSQPDNRDQAIEIIDTLVLSGAVDVIVVDGLRPTPSTAAWFRHWGTRDAAVIFVSEASARG